MKIIHLISSMDKGGAESHLATLTKMQNKNNKVIIIYFKGNNYWKKKLQKKNINVIRRKIFTSENIKKGEIFTHKNLIPLRSKVGVSVKYWKKYLGKKAKKNYKFLSPILS